MSSDKTVGGQTRPWWEALFEKWLPGLQSLHDLLDEAFEGHSHGIRDGLERAANLALDGIRQGLDAIDIEEAIRAEASKLDGEESKPLRTFKDRAVDALVAACRRAIDTKYIDGRSEIADALLDYLDLQPEPPAEERKLPLGHEFDSVGDLGYATELDICQHPIRHPAGDQVCGQPRSAHEPTR
jgi:hypothetical protein